jgi:hypothetical protein
MGRLWSFEFNIFRLGGRSIEIGSASACQMIVETFYTL